MSSRSSNQLRGVAVVITRPVGHGRRLARAARRMHATPVLLPGLSLRAVADSAAARAQLRQALAGDFVLFSSPSAVQFAARLLPLAGRARLGAVGRGTASALRRAGVSAVLVPDSTQDAAGLLAHPALQALDGRPVAVVGAAGGRGVLQAGLAARGARVVDLHVYERRPARLDGRHRRAVDALPEATCVLLSSAAALRGLQAGLGGRWPALSAHVAIVSSARMQAVATAAGFARVIVAHSAVDDDLLACVRESFGS